MKKFTQLITGDSFKYQGKTYLKTGPLTARSIDDSEQRMIPRSAVALPLTDAPPVPDEIRQQQLPAEQVLEAFEHYHKGCMDWLQLTEEVDASLASKIREAMAVARQRFLNELQQLQGHAKN